MSKKIRLIGPFLALFLWGFADFTQAAAVVETVAVKGDTSPTGSEYKAFLGKPAVSDDPTNEVAFLGATEDNEKCIFKVDDANAGDTAACLGEASPFDSKKYTRLSDPSINTGGEAAWSARLVAGWRGVFKGDPSSVVSLLGDPAPGGGLLKEFSLAVITDNSKVVYRASITGAGDADHALFLCSDGDGDCSSGTGDLDELVRKKDAVPDDPSFPDRIFCEFTHLDAASDNGTVWVTFRAKTTDETVDPDCEDPDKVGIFRIKYDDSTDTIDAFTTLALEDSFANPFPVLGGTRYDAFQGSPAINNSGLVAFQAALRGNLPGQRLYHCDTSCSDGGTKPEIKVALGDAALCGGDFGDFSPPDISDAGDMTFRGRSTGNKLGVYIRDAGGTIEKCACKGDAIADIDGDVDDDAVYTSFDPPAMSSGGRVAFKASFKRTDGTTPKHGDGLFLCTP